MRKVFNIIAIIIGSLMTSTLSQAQTGLWHSYMSYAEPQQIVKAGNMLYVRASGSLYSYNLDDQTITTYDKTNIMSDVVVENIAWCGAAKRLVVVYNNGLIDLISPNDERTTISGFYTKTITTTKQVYTIGIYDHYAYLCTDFGIMKVDVARGEISDTYQIGKKVYCMALTSTAIYAKIDNGPLLRAFLSDNLFNSNNWKETTEWPNADFSDKQPDYDSYINLVRTLSPDGPKYNNNAFLRLIGNTLYTCTGVTDATYDPSNPGTIQLLNTETKDWTVFDDDIPSVTGHKYVDLACLDVDPTDPTHVFACGRVGLYEFRDGRFVKEYNIHNSPLQSAATNKEPNKDYCLVQSVKFDAEGNLYVLNSISSNTSLLCLKADGEWENLHSSRLMLNSNYSLENMREMMFDSNGLLWFVNDHWRGKCAVSYDPATGTLKKYDNLSNQDGTPLTINYMHDIAEDHEGNIWIGSTTGPLLIPKENIGDESSSFTQIKVPRNDGTNYADYLLSGVDVTSIAIDGGNRKWFGTSDNGIYVISADNMTQLYHYTADNSDLISNNIKDIELHPHTGEAFIATDNGLCSIMSDVTVAPSEPDYDNCYAYPNPVAPGYSGLITVVGLPYNGYVKVVSASGALIREGRAVGGTFTWDGNDRNGRRVASGVYTVLSATTDGSKSISTKIAIVN